MSGDRECCHLSASHNPTHKVIYYTYGEYRTQQVVHYTARGIYVKIDAAIAQPQHRWHLLIQSTGIHSNRKGDAIID